jgi:PAS domain S-box-containing protein/putative nucleotidyltransferase with HDIG domain
MPNKPATLTQLAAEKEELRARLDEAEEALHAIRNGAVDALVVSTVGGEQIFTISDSDRPYRMLIEEMSEGALTMTAEGLILYANRSFAELIKMPLEKVIGATLYNWIAPGSLQNFHSLLDTGLTGKRREQLVVIASDGTLVPVYLSVSRLLFEGMPDSYCLVATDLTEQKHSEAIVASEQLSRELLAASNQSRRALLSMIEDQKQVEVALNHSNRALTSLSEVNRTLVRVTSEDELLQAICQSIVKQRGYRLACVSYAQQDEARSVKVMARAGHDEGYLDAAQISWAENARGMGPTGRAIRSGVTELCTDIANDPSFLPWREAALERGYAASIALPLLNADNTAFGTLNIYTAEADVFIPAEVELLEELAGDLAFGVQTLHIRRERDAALELNQKQLVQLRDNFEDTVRAIATIVEMRDPYTAGHQIRVADLAEAIARKMELPDEQVHAIHLSGVLHDLGKIQIPAEILSKPGKITDIEFSLIKIHPQAGYDMLHGINFPWPIAQIVLQHHERMDGSGYPQGLRGDAILLEARVISVADVVEAMASHRPYRGGLGVEIALAEITKWRGRHFDPLVVDMCLALFRERHYAFKV